MNFLFKWLRAERTERIALHPARALELSVPFDEAFHRCKEGIEAILGGVVREHDPTLGTIEATFGLAFSERLTCSLERLDDRRTRVRVASRRGAVGQPRSQSDYVDRLAGWLEGATSG